MNFSFAQTQQPQQFQMGQQPQQFQMGQQPQQFQMGQQPNLMEMQRQQNQRIHLQHLNIVLHKIGQIQNQPQFQYLIQILTAQQKLANEQLQKSMDQTDIKKVNVTQIEDLYRRGQRIKDKNAVLLNKMLLVKSKLERLMYQDMNANSKHEYETSQAMDKARSLKSEITQKCAYLKTLKFNKSNEYVEKRNLPKRSTFAQVGTALTELKNGTEILEREVLKQKTQMEFISKYLNQGN